MLKSLSKGICVILIIALALPGSVLLSGNAYAAPSGSNFQSSQHVMITITNNLVVPSPAPYDEMVVVNSSEFSFYENSNLSNVWFSYTNGTLINSWLQSGNSASDNNTTYWLRLNYSIPGGGSAEVYMNFLPKGSIAFNNNTTGEAPQLTSSYARYDNGANVFNLYDNFSGNSLNNALWTTQGTPSEITVNNGINFTEPQSAHTLAIVSTKTFSSPSYTEAYGSIPGSNQVGSTSYFLGGVGFGYGGISSTSPVMISGWAQNDTNGPGLSIWKANGNAYTYNYSTGVNASQPQVYGVGYINASYTTGVAGGSIQNQTSLALGSNSGGPLNAVIGFQDGNEPLKNHFTWVFVRSAMQNGELNIPYYVVGQPHKITFVPHDLPAGVSWSATINGTTYSSTGGNISLMLLNGYYTAQFSASSGYVPYPLNITNISVDGSAITHDVSFESPGNLSYINAVSTMYDGMQAQQPGYVQSLSSSSGKYAISSMALDQNGNTVFTALPLLNSINSYNLSDNIHKTLDVGAQIVSIYYDNYSRLLYATSLTTQNLSIIDPATMSIVKNLSIPWIQDNYSEIVQGSISGTIYVISCEPYFNGAPINIEILDTNGTMVGRAIFSNINDTSFAYSLIPVAEYGGNLLFTNYTGLWELNPVTGSTTFTAAPSGFESGPATRFGAGADFIIGDMNTSYVPDMFYNASTHKFSKGLDLGGTVFSGAFDNFTGFQYLQYYNLTSSNGGIAVVSVKNNTIMATSPYPTISFQTVLNSNNGYLYSIDNPYMVSPPVFVHVMSISRIYSVTFEESNIQSGEPWVLSVNGVVHTLYSSSYTLSGINGTSFTYEAENTTSYYLAKGTSPTSGSITVEGSNITVDFNYAHWAYITGLFNQTGINVTINGVQLSSGSPYFNESVVQGTYQVVISAPGFATQYRNFTLGPGNVENISTTLSPLQKPQTGALPLTDYYLIGAGIAAVAAVIGIMSFRRRK